MTTKTIKLSESAIKKALADPDVSQLKDPRYSLYFKCHTGRESGTFYLYHYANNKQYPKKLGTWPQVKVKALLSRLDDVVADVAIDPESVRVVQGDFNSLAELLVWYRERTEVDPDLSDSRRSAIKSAINGHLVPRIGGLDIESINKRRLNDLLLWQMKTEGYQISYIDLVFRVLKQATATVYKLDMLDSDPVASFKLADFMDVKLEPKPGALRMDQVPKQLKPLASMKLERQVFVLLLLLFATRRTETRLARWDQFDFTYGYWHIPGTNTKNGKPLRLPLTDLSVEVLRRYKRWQRKRYKGEWLFPGKRHGKPISDSAVGSWLQVLGVKKWSAHDVRKLARTVWADIGVDYYVGEQLLNHTLSKLDNTYIHTVAEAQQKDALSRWHIFLLNQIHTCLSAELNPIIQADQAQTQQGLEPIMALTR